MYAIPTLYKNGIEIDGGSKFRLIQTHFAHPVDESDMFQAAMNEFMSTGEFEFVVDNDVYLLKNQYFD